MCALLQGQHARTQLSPPRSPPETRQVDRGGQSLADRPQGRSRLLEKLGIDLPKLGRQMKGDPRRQCGVEVKGTDFAVRQWCEPCVSLSCVTLGKLLNLSVAQFPHRDGDNKSTQLLALLCTVHTHIDTHK